MSSFYFVFKLLVWLLAYVLPQQAALINAVYEQQQLVTSDYRNSRINYLISIYFDKNHL